MKTRYTFDADLARAHAYRAVIVNATDMPGDFDADEDVRRHSGGGSPRNDRGLDLIAQLRDGFRILAGLFSHRRLLDARTATSRDRLVDATHL